MRTRLGWCFGQFGLIGLCVPGSALAGGIEYTENGAKILGRAGAWAAKADDPLAMHYNPAGLTLLGGHEVYLGLNLTQLQLEYTRTGIEQYIIGGDDNPDDDLYESATITNHAPPFFAPSLAYGYGADRWGVAFGVYGPGAYGKPEFPATGPQKFQLGHSDFLLAYVTGAGAVKITDWLSIGASFQWVVVPLGKFAVTLDGALSPTAAADNAPFIATTEIEVQDWAAFSGIIGFHIKPSACFELGLSSRFVPIYIEAEGEFTLAFANEGAKAIYESSFGWFDKDGNPDQGLTLKLVVAPWIRAAARYIYREPDGSELFDLELDLVYEFWSVFQDLEIAYHGRLYPKQDGKPSGDPIEMPPTIKLPRRYLDTFAVRVGGDVQVVPDLLTLRAGFHFETASSPNAYTILDFLGFFRAGWSLGLTLKPVKWLEIDLAYQLVWQPPRTVAPGTGKQVATRPLSDPPAPDGWDEATQGPYPGLTINEGRYLSAYHTAALSLGLHF
jgi:long-chain fatty acid transport protein